MTEILEDFDLDAEITLLEQQGASAQKYFMHSNAHQMAFTKYATSAKGAKESGNVVLAKKLNSMGKKHKAAAEALAALAGHHVDHEFSRQLRVKQAMKENINESRDRLPDTVSHSHGVTTFSRGHSFSVVLHPEHKAAIRKLQDGENHTFQDETRSRWTATRNAGKIHFKHHDRGLQHTVDAHHIHEELEVTDTELNELSKVKLQKYSRLASKDSKKDRSKGIALAQDKLRTEETEDDENLVIEVNFEDLEDDTEDFNPIQELISLAIEQKPMDFTNLVQDIIRSVAADRLSVLGEELAKQIGGTIDEEIEELTEDEIDELGDEFYLGEAHSDNQLRQAKEYHQNRSDHYVNKKAERRASLHRKAAKVAGGMLRKRAGINEISVPPTGKPVLADHGKSISDPSTKNPPTLTQGKNGAVKGNAKTPEQKSVSKSAGDTFRTQEAAD